MDRSLVAQRLRRLCGPVTAALILTGVSLRSVCMVACFDTSVGYFNGGFLPALSNILYFLAVAVAIAWAALTPKGLLPAQLRDSGRRPVAYLWGLSLAVFTIGVLAVCYENRTNDFLTYPMVLGVLSSLYFFASGNKTGRFSDGIVALGFIPVVWCVCAAWETYTDQFTAMNSPIKVSLQMGFLGLALVLISELRFRLGKALPRLAVALTSIGVFLSLNGGVPVLLGIGVGVLTNTLHLFYATVLLCGGLYGAILLFRSFTPNKAPSSTQTANAPIVSPTDFPNVE